MFCCVIGTGCSVLRSAKSGTENEGVEYKKTGRIGDAFNNNLSKSAFFIKRAEVHFSDAAGDEHLVATIKCKDGNDYLISLRSRAGIEVARILITKDTILANDRINKILYFGEPAYFSRRYSMPVEIFPLIFGDFLKGNNSPGTDIECNNGKWKFVTKLEAQQLTYEIDCRNNKAMSASVSSPSTAGDVILSYADFNRSGDILYPGKISIKGLPDGMELNIEIKNIELDWEGEMDFIPGSKYEKRELR